MSVVTISDVWPRGEDRPLTVADLRRPPDDANRYELVDGVLEVSPAPFNIHERVVTRLATMLAIRCPRDMERGPVHGDRPRER